MIIKLFIRNALDATKLHAHFQKFPGVTPPTPKGSRKRALHKKVQQNQKRSKIWVILPNNIFLPTALEGHDVLCLWGGS